MSWMRRVCVAREGDCTKAAAVCFQERWRLTAEQSKVESLQRALEEERRVLTQQISMEREELERAKVREHVCQCANNFVRQR